MEVIKSSNTIMDNLRNQDCVQEVVIKDELRLQKDARISSIKLFGIAFTFVVLSLIIYHVMNFDFSIFK
jgi:hypothetical protein